MVGAAARAVSKLPNWSIVENRDDVLRAVRTTNLLRFNDVTVKAPPGSHSGHSRPELHSASRVGKSGLGHSPRNLRELVGALEKELG